MKNLRFIAFTMLTVLFFSCNKEEHLDIDMTIISSGSLTINFVNDAGEPISGANVEIGYSCNNPFNEAKTGDDGKVYFDNIIEGAYCIQAKDIVVNGVEYEVQRNVMIAAGKNTEITINPLDYTASLELKVKANYYGYSTITDTVVPNANVGLISSSDYFSMSDFDNMVDKIVISGKTDANGEVSFTDVPTDVYYVLVYYDKDHYELYSNNIFLQKGDELDRTITLNYQKIFDLQGDLSLHLYVRKYPSETVNVANANVILTKIYTYGYMDAVNNSVATGMTDGNGNITFKNLDVDDYYVHVYYSDSKYDRTTSDYNVYLNETTHYEIELDEHDLGL
ncbi:MAG: carboxypeptidase-like regulatory domain-containing protein [Bacteroidales bacterium]|nr:carboxypeptidase-like regulatory domain-containing protein [Bacteroidales bacterium]